VHEKVVRRTAADFLRRLVAVIHTVLTDNGKHFTTLGNTSSAAPDIRAAIEAGEPIWAHAFEHACARLDIDHRLTKPKHPWTNGQVERMNRALKDAIVKRYYYETHDQLRTHLGDFVTACDFARRLKTLKGLTPYEFICKLWTKEPQRFNLNPLHHMPGLKHLAWGFLPIDYREDRTGEIGRGIHQLVCASSFKFVSSTITPEHA
jgi:transposase InsO family protein